MSAVDAVSSLLADLVAESMDRGVVRQCRIASFRIRSRLAPLDPEGRLGDNVDNSAAGVVPGGNVGLATLGSLWRVVDGQPRNPL
jgi:hypothetical protein